MTALVAGRLPAARPVAAAEMPLPPLRPEVCVRAGATNDDGSPAWSIQDPVRNRFFRIGWMEHEMLRRWGVGHASALVDAVNDETTLAIDDEDVRQFLLFLSGNQLVRASRPEQVDYLCQVQQRSRRSVWEWLIHSYLFFRVPLARPQRWLAAVMPALACVFSWRAAMVVGGLGVAGVYLVSRQWDVFVHTLTDQITWSGLAGYLVALAFAKTLHELGHALTATYYGVRVGHMGVAFLVMFPMLYTDTGESWRLTNSRHRLAIASAGIVVELALAGLCTLAWCLTPDGAIRNGLFFLATTSWVLTLAINASPFMRFDGYFILSDLLDIPNLHQRAGALARTWLRRNLLGLELAWPENFSLVKRRWLIAFALATWVYRVTVFAGIALLVYHYFFKVLGIALMLVEIYWFLAQPAIAELKAWRASLPQVSWRRRALAAALLALVAGLVLFPFRKDVVAPGWLHAQDQFAFYAPFAARVAATPAATTFKRGDVVFALDSGALDIDQARSLALVQARERQLAGLVGLPAGEGKREALESERAMFEAQAQGASLQIARLLLRAPFDGSLRDSDHLLAPGAWVAPTQPLGTLVAAGGWVVDAFVPEDALQRIHTGQSARVRVMSEPVAWLSGQVLSVDPARTPVLPAQMLAAPYGGPIATVPSRPVGSAGLVQPQEALFRVRITLDQPWQGEHASVVHAMIESESESIAAEYLRRAAAVLVRESGF